VPQLPMLLHPLAPDVKCPACGAGLTFVRVRGYGDLYACASDCSCKCAVFHFQNKGTRACGYVVIYIYGPMGEWTACEAVKGNDERIEAKLFAGPLRLASRASSSFAFPV
jgi:hypothetical protein